MDSVKKSKIAAKQQKYIAKEKAMTDFLLQFAFTIACSMILTVIYSGLLGRYGSGFFSVMSTFIWVAVYVFAAVTIAFFVIRRITKKNIYFMFMLYSLALFLGFAWITLFQRFMYFLSKYIGFLSFLSNTMTLMKILYVFLGIAIVIEIVLYFVRINKIKQQKG